LAASSDAFSQQTASPQASVEQMPVDRLEEKPASTEAQTKFSVSESVNEESSSTTASATTRSAHLQSGEAHLDEDEAARANAAAAHERERRANGAIMPRRLLLAVSNTTLMTQLNSLIRAAGYEARASFDAPQALNLMRIERPDLLLLEYDLQGFDGIEMLRRLRKQQGGRISLPVVLLLSGESEGARSEAIELGVRAVVHMPYDPAELLESVRLAGSGE
jgi:CheY-like chemotaxis protein